jgi:glucose/arabinose dehydrogenase
MKKLIVFLIVLLFPLPAACSPPKVGEQPQTVEDAIKTEVEAIRVESWVEGLEVPWSLVFLPDGRALVSERPGRVRLIRDGKLRPEPYAILEVAATGEGGLMGLAVHPAFPGQPFIYAMYTYRHEGGLRNRVVRLRDQGEAGTIESVILDDLPGARVHNGGRIAFGPDGLLYVATGEQFKGERAQDLAIPAGKILRVTPEGKVPPGNPFGTSVYSFGHRNPQGLAWEPATGALFISEHGPSGEGGRFGHDEINLIVQGGNYGWPEVIGAPGLEEYVDPLIVWKSATPPAGMTFYDGDLLARFQGDLFVATLRSEALIRIAVAREEGSFRVETIERWFARDMDSGVYGRLRDVVQGPDGALYVATSNRDGRGDPRPGDDRIYRITPAAGNVSTLKRLMPSQ